MFSKIVNIFKCNSNSQTHITQDQVLQPVFQTQNAKEIPESVKKMIEREDKLINEQQIQNVQQEQKQQQQLTIEEAENCIDLQIQSETNAFLRNEKTKFACCINLKTQIKERKNRVPMDLVCVIDDSGSMASRAKLVRKSLKYLLKILGQDDRICLISFDSYAKVLTPFLKINDQNKAELKKAISQIMGRGSTRIDLGMEQALYMLKERETKNKISCIFLLSDGQDDQPNIEQRVQNLIKQQNIQENLIINTYGYGADHDAVQMRNIAEKNKGGYYYIENVKKVSEWFILSISGLLSVLGENLSINVKVTNPNFSIVNFFAADEQVQEKKKGESYIVNLPLLILGDKKIFIFECEYKGTAKEAQENVSYDILMANFSVKLLNQETIVHKKAQLSIKYVESKENVQNNKLENYYEDLISAYHRSCGALKIKDAKDLLNEKQFDKAKELLQQYDQQLDFILEQYPNNKGLQHLKDDISDAIKKCQPKLYRQASFEKMNVVHLQRRNSLVHCEDWNECEQECIDKYNNKEYCLSDDSCDLSDEEEQQQNPQKRKLSLMRVQRNGSYIYNSNKSVDNMGDSDSEQENECENEACE